MLTQVNGSFRLAFNRPWLALTLVELKYTQVDATFSPFDHPTQVDTIWSKVNYIYVKFTTFCDLRELAIRLANPCGHPSQVCTQLRVDLRIRLASFKCLKCLIKCVKLETFLQNILTSVLCRLHWISRHYNVLLIDEAFALSLTIFLEPLHWHGDILLRMLYSKWSW